MMLHDLGPSPYCSTLDGVKRQDPGVLPGTWTLDELKITKLAWLGNFGFVLS